MDPAALVDALEASEARLDMTRLGVEIGDRMTLGLLNAELAPPQER